MKATVIVRPKENVLDPQGVAVCEAMRQQGLAGVLKVRVGKYLEIELEKGGSTTGLDAICRDLLSNPVIEDYELRIEA